jgi:hypothetical protein
MKKLFYRLSSRRSFAKLFLILACAALPSLFAQHAVAQILGWDPGCLDNCPATGDWDAHLTCGAVQGTTTITHNPTSVLQEGKVDCTFQDTARLCNPATDPNCVCANGTCFFEETASCSLSIQFANLSETCADNLDGTSTLTVTGICPSQQGQKKSGAFGSGGTIDCRAKDANGNPTPLKNPTFCKYQGTNPFGNTGNDCRWNVGYGALQGSNVGNLSPNDCTDLFGSSAVVFSYIQTNKGKTCTGAFAGLGKMDQDFCHSDTWNGATLATCDVKNLGGPKNSATGVVVNRLTADTEYNQNTVNPTCNPNNVGKITVTALANPKETDQHQNPIVLENIDQSTITVNGFPRIPGTCTSPSPGMTALTCQVNKCIGDQQGISHNIIANTISSDGQTATLTWAAQMFNGTSVVGDVETVNVSTNVP